MTRRDDIAFRAALKSALHRLPLPENYYRNVFRELRHTRDNWHSTRCPFHEDKHESFSISLSHGGWKCFADCGTGDLLSFHMRKHGCGFKRAVFDLTGVQL